ncbi:MAG: energy coupling factor transporter S component ThiW [Clostridiales bacterium]|nr:energy coupling factor transporter S component ThiW [Clostridiales bacterium]
MNRNPSLLRLTTLAMLVALGVIISPILRVEGMCPMAHLINIVCAVLLGPWYSLLCATVIGILRMIFMGIPPLALTGAVFGAFFSGVFYRVSNGRLIFGVLGEIFVTGIIGAIVSAPVMTALWGYEGLTLFYYVPSFICGTLIGGSVAFLLLKQLAKNGMLFQMQAQLGAKVFDTPVSAVGEALAIAAVGMIAWLAVKVALKSFFGLSGAFFDAMPMIVLALFLIGAAIYYISSRKEAVHGI